MGNKPYFAVKPADSGGDFVDISDSLRFIEMKGSIPFDELHDVSISIGERPFHKLTESSVAVQPRIRIPIVVGETGVAEVIFDLNSKEWWKIQGEADPDGVCRVTGKVAHNGNTLDIHLTGTLTDIDVIQERVPEEGPDFGTSVQVKVLGLLPIPKADE